jgi:hypothetical protein
MSRYQDGLRYDPYKQVITDEYGYTTTERLPTVAKSTPVDDEILLNNRISSKIAAEGAQVNSTTVNPLISSYFTSNRAGSILHCRHNGQQNIGAGNTDVVVNFDTTVTSSSSWTLSSNTFTYTGASTAYFIVYFKTGTIDANVNYRCWLQKNSSGTITYWGAQQSNAAASSGGSSLGDSYPFSNITSFCCIVPMSQNDFFNIYIRSSSATTISTNTVSQELSENQILVYRAFT